MKKRTTYEEQVATFNMAAGSRYIPGIHFLKFRKTKKGIKVGFTIGKPHEIAGLYADVQRAAHPYYCTFSGRR